MTATDEDRVLLAAIEAGCAGFVSKSSDLDELLGAVRAVAAGEVHMPPVFLRRLLPRLRRADGGRPSALTPREVEVLRLIADGLSNTAIAARLTVSVHTVRNHVQNLLSKLGAHSKLEALAIAVREGLLDEP